jgi:two-component system sensor histidine kinase HydH
MAKARANSRTRRAPVEVPAVARPASGPEPDAQPLARAQGGPSLTAEELAQMLASFHEVTDRLTRTHESLQARVAQLQGELHEANRQVQRSRHLALLGEMAAGIAHEVRNPLGSILLYTRILQEDLAGQGAPLEVVGKIAGSVRRLESVVSDVLAFAREAKPRLVACDGAELLEAAVEAARSDEAPWQGLAVRVLPGAVEVHADPGQVQRALVNLVRNGAEIMHERPRAGAPRELVLGAGRTTALMPDGTARAMVSLQVRDRGPGISEQEAPSLFTPFYTTKRTGTGLGLAIVHRIVDAHGGRVSLRSWHEPGGTVGGAVAEVLLPAGPAEPAEPGA